LPGKHEFCEAFNRCADLKAATKVIEEYFLSDDNYNL